MSAEIKGFINFTNHPSQNWSEDQLDAASQYGHIIDIPFPPVATEASTATVMQMAEKYCSLIEEYAPNAVMVQGEFTLTYHIVRILKEKGIRVLAACAERDVFEEAQSDGMIRKFIKYRFAQFREY